MLDTELSKVESNKLNAEQLVAVYQGILKNLKCKDGTSFYRNSGEGITTETVTTCINHLVYNKLPWKKEDASVGLFFEDMIDFQSIDFEDKSIIEDLDADLLFVDKSGAEYTLNRFFIAVQFYLAISNVILKSENLFSKSSETNLGTFLDDSTKLQTTLVNELIKNANNNQSITNCLLDFIFDKLGTPTLSHISQKKRQDLKNKINSLFKDRFTQILEAPHFDEFLILLEPTSKNDLFFCHKSKISTVLLAVLENNQQSINNDNYLTKQNKKDFNENLAALNHCLNKFKANIVLESIEQPEDTSVFQVEKIKNQEEDIKNLTNFIDECCKGPKKFNTSRLNFLHSSKDVYCDYTTLKKSSSFFIFLENLNNLQYNSAPPSSLNLLFNELKNKGLIAQKIASFKEIYSVDLELDFSLMEDLIDRNFIYNVLAFLDKIEDYTTFYLITKNWNWSAMTIDRLCPLSS